MKTRLPSIIGTRPASDCSRASLDEISSQLRCARVSSSFFKLKKKEKTVSSSRYVIGKCRSYRENFDIFQSIDSVWRGSTLLCNNHSIKFQESTGRGEKRARRFFRLSKLELAENESVSISASTSRNEKDWRKGLVIRGRTSNCDMIGPGLPLR